MQSYTTSANTKKIEFSLSRKMYLLTNSIDTKSYVRGHFDPFAHIQLGEPQ